MSEPTSIVFGRLMAERWSDEPYPLHGLYRASSGKRSGRLYLSSSGSHGPSRECDHVLYPLGEVYRRFQDIYWDSPRLTLATALGAVAVRDHFELLIRSIERTALSEAAYARAINVQSGEHRFPLSEHRDVRIDFDSVITYARILADSLVTLLYAFFAENGDQLPKIVRLRSLIKKAESPRSSWHDFFGDDVPGRWDLSWFYALAGHGENSKREGLRDARFHYGATTFLVGRSPEPPSSTWRVTGHLSGRSAYSSDLLADLKSICRGLLAFMDHVVREAGKRDSRLSLGDGVYTDAAIMPVLDDETGLEEFLPIIEFTRSIVASGEDVQSGVS